MEINSKIIFPNNKDLLLDILRDLQTIMSHNRINLLNDNNEYKISKDIKIKNEKESNIYSENRRGKKLQRKRKNPTRTEELFEENYFKTAIDIEEEDKIGQIREDDETKSVGLTEKILLKVFSKIRNLIIKINIYKINFYIYFEIIDFYV